MQPTQAQALEELESAKHDITMGRFGDVYSRINKAIAALSSAAPSAAEPVAVTDDMVTRFLGWKLPQDFAPDCGISFTPPRHPNGWPIGTNLLNATQARQMIAHVLAASPSSQSASELGVTQAARDVLAERQRQISAEGYTPEHDDEHGAEEFGRAASVYANSHVYDVIGASYMGWPWDEAWYKPTTQRRDFVKAAALLLAGIECIDRAAGIAAPPAPQAASEPVLPHPGSPEASAIIDSKLAEYNWPSNSKNAARAGFEAARALLAARPVKPMRAAEMAGAAAKEHMKFLNGLTEAETRATASVAGLSGDAEREALTEERPRAPKAFREPEPGTPWWQTAKDCGAWTDRGEGDLGYVHFGSVEALRVFAGKIARQAEAALHSTGKPDGEVAELRSEAMQDMAYANGAQAGFALGMLEDHDGLRKLIESRASALGVLKQLRAAPADAPVAEPVALTAKDAKWCCYGGGVLRKDCDFPCTARAALSQGGGA